MAALLLLCTLLPVHAVLAKPDDVIKPDSTLPDEAVSERKAMFDVTVSDGTHNKLAVFIYELGALGGASGNSENGPHLSQECKGNQDVAVVSGRH